MVITRPLSCSGEETWQHGNSLVNYMKLVEMDGLTGKVKFDQLGLRTDFTLEIVELKRKGLTMVGSWHDQHGFKFLNHPTESRSEVVESLENKTLVVTTIKVSSKLLAPNILMFCHLQSPPYAVLAESAKKLVGNEAFEGWVIRHEMDK